MGQEILYCVGCQTQLRGADFDKRRAVRIDGKGYCVDCARSTFPAERLDATAPPPPSTRTSIPKPTRRVAPAATSRKGPLLIGGAAALVLIAVLVALLSGGNPPPPPPPPAPPKEARREAAPAARPLPETAGLDAEVQAALAKEEFAQALRLIESARSRSAAAEWTRIVNQRIDTVHERAERSLQPLKARAVEAKRAGDLEEPRKIREVVAAWEVGRALTDLDAALAAVPEAKVVYAEDFNAGRGRFEGGDLTAGALSVPPQGVVLQSPFPSPIPPTAALRFRVKPPPGFRQLEVVLWSSSLRLNSWVHVDGLKGGEWQPIEVKFDQFKGGWDRKGPGVIGETGNTLRVYFDTRDEATRVLIDDFELRE